MGAVDLKKYYLLKEANKLLDRIESNVKLIVNHAKNTSTKKAA